MKEPLLVCPECEDENVLVISETSYHVNTGEFYCHSVKTHDFNATARCLKCYWSGERQDLHEKS